jgi:single-stranded-DNA-specific exonuclease
LKVKKWILKKLSTEKALEISQKFDLPFFLSILLEARSIKDLDSIRDFLSDEYVFRDPFLIKDMDKAVDRIKKAIDCFEKICVYGDYDADGVTATTLLYSYLEEAGADVIYFIPKRDDVGYGLNNFAIETLKEQGVSLLITVDNGVSAIKEVDFANSLGIDTIITDHHRPPENLPQAVAIIDLHQKDCHSDFKDLSGVGVAFKLVMALENDRDNMCVLIEKYMDLVAIGTIADSVTLLDENREFVKAGIKCILKADRQGLRAIMDEACLLGKDLKAQDIAFMLAPRINAVGRLGSSEKVVKLLLSKDDEDTFFLAQELGKQNQLRKNIEINIVNQVEEFINRHKLCLFEPILVIWGEFWHAGVIGIVASKLIERYGKPCIVMAVEGDKAKGSGRSVEGFSLHKAVSSCAEHLVRFGGHPMAVGFEIKSNKIEAFYQEILKFAKQEVIPPLSLNIDGKLNIDSLDIGLVKQMDLLEPFGCGNLEPMFGLFNVTLNKILPVGGGNHLKLSLEKDGKSITAMKFATCLDEFGYRAGDIVDIAFNMNCSEYMGEESLSIFVRDIHFSDLDIDEILNEKRIYDQLRRGEKCDDIGDIIPQREDFALIYRYLKSHKRWTGSEEILYFRLRSAKIRFIKLLLIIDVMEEMNLVDLNYQNGLLIIKINEIERKIDIGKSLILKKVKSSIENES